MIIPDYFAEAFLRRLERISRYAKCSRDDLRTINALRVMRKDIEYLKRRKNESRQ